MAHSFLFLTHDKSLAKQGARKRGLLRRILNKGMSVLGGSESGGAFTAVSSGTDPASGCTCGISASGSGTVGLTISAVALTATWATSDTNSAGLVAAVVNSSTNAKVQHLYGATNLKSTVTLASVLAGTTVTMAGFIFTAIAGTVESNRNGEFIIGGTDTQDGASFCAAVNRHPAASRFLFALNVAGACHVFPKSAAWFTGPGAPENAVRASAATVTVGSATFAASAYYGVWAKLPGKWANGIVVAASGTGQTIENSNTYMSRGLGMDAAPTTDTI